MTLREFIHSAGQYWVPVFAILVAVPAVSFLVGMSHRNGEGRNAPWKFAYTALVYLACIPGIFAAVLTAYTMFFIKESLLDANPLIYFMPIATMVVTLVLIRKRVSFEDVPGFDRLSGLMVLIGCSFAIALALHKTRILIGFFGSVGMLFVLAAGVFALLKWGGAMLFRSRSEQSRAMPKLPPIEPQDKF
jgi:hypothetical protein